VHKLTVNGMAKWIKGRQGEELSEVLRNTPEPDGHNNGKAHVDDAGTAHAFMAAKEKVMYDEHGEARPTSSLQKRSRCSSGKAVEAACVKSLTRVERQLSKEAWEPLDYAAYALRVLPLRVQEAVDEARKQGLLPEASQ
jgi:hypothetical protein